MKEYLALFRVRFITSLQYRAAALAGIATQFAWGFMELLAFSAFYKVNPGAFPMEFRQVVTYIWIQQAFLAMFMVWFYENEIFAAIQSGAIAYELVRPVDLYNRWFSSSVANRLAKAVLRSMPILIVAFLVPPPLRMSLPPSGGQFALFFLSTFLALGVVVSFNMLVYISTFYTLSPVGARIIAAMLADFLAGSIIPLPFFPAGFRYVAELLPFAAMQNMPLRIYSGHISGTAALYGIGFQIVWLITLVGLGKFLMKHALRRVVVQGG
ncbi:MAG: ABC transporter permease [Limnochordia bacterium]|jgi:ABC-2 type transport system permease protein|nr:ABC transporter permease [Bacillota bacterium]